MPTRPLHALLLPPGQQLLDALAAAIDGGPALLPLDPSAPVAVRDRLLTQLRPHALVDVAGIHELPDPAQLDEDVAVVIVTSGSAGAPKGVQLSAAAVLHSAKASLSRLGAQPGQRWLCALPTHHIAGLQVLTRSLVAASTPEIAPRFAVGAVAGSDAHFVSLVPAALTRLLDAGVDLSRFHAVLLGGSNLPAALLSRAQDAGASIVSTYGMTETAGGCVYDGVPLDGVSVELNGDGRIRLAGPVLANGYRLAPEATAAAFVDGWHLTQDVGALDDGGTLSVHGRVDDVVITGGVNVSVLQVAGMLNDHPAVVEAAAFGRPDPHWGHRLVAVVVPRSPNEPPTLDQLREHVAALAGPAAAPREIIVVDALPRLPGGKLDRVALAALPEQP